MNQEETRRRVSFWYSKAFMAQEGTEFYNQEAFAVYLFNS